MALAFHFQAVLDLNMKQTEKEKFYFLVLASATAILAMGVWRNYRPVVLASNCSEVAYKSSQVYTRNQLETDANVLTYDRLYEDCIREVRNQLP
jgi:hypothetical protein